MKGLAASWGAGCCHGDDLPVSGSKGAGSKSSPNMEKDSILWKQAFSASVNALNRYRQVIL